MDTWGVVRVRGSGAAGLPDGWSYRCVGMVCCCWWFVGEGVLGERGIYTHEQYSELAGFFNRKNGHMYGILGDRLYWGVADLPAVTTAGGCRGAAALLVFTFALFVAVISFSIL